MKTKNFGVYEVIFNGVAVLSLIASFVLAAVAVSGLNGSMSGFPFAWAYAIAGLWSALLARVAAVVLEMVTEIRNATVKE